jgi:hypothetical protein
MEPEEYLYFAGETYGMNKEAVAELNSYFIEKVTSLD